MNSEQKRKGMNDWCLIFFLFQVEVDNGIVKDGEFELCTSVTDVTLPKDYYFGVTAATGGLAGSY